MAKFPPLPLKDAAEAVEKLFGEIQRSEVDPISASKALGYASDNGAARTKLGVLNSYGLIDRSKGLIKVSSLGVAIAHPLGDSRSKGLKEAALNVPMFKEIWDQHRQCNEKVLASTLVHKGMDQGAADQAAKIFKANVSFASLGDGDYSSPDTPTESQEKRDHPSVTTGKTTPNMTANIRYLPIPLDIGDAPIPVGMSEADFELLLDTLKLWKKKIVVPSKADIGEELAE